MARVRCVIGYVHEDVEVTPGVWKPEVVERFYRGTILRNSRQVLDDDKINSDLVVQNSFSFVANAYAREHFHAIRYIKWSGAHWKVTEVTEESPRLILRMGGVYDGVKAPTPSTP